MSPGPISFALQPEEPDWATDNTAYRWRVGDGVSEVIAIKQADGQLEVTLHAFGYEPATITTSLPPPKRDGVELVMSWPDAGRARLTLNETETTYAPLQPRSKPRPPSTGRL